MGVGLRPASKAADEPPDPKVGAPALYPASRSPPRGPEDTPSSTSAASHRSRDQPGFRACNAANGSRKIPARITAALTSRTTNASAESAGPHLAPVHPTP